MVFHSDGEIVTVALSQVGNVGGEPYWNWYGFNSRVEWCACFVVCFIFFDLDNKGSSGVQDGLSDHVGIVEKVENGVVYTVEENSGDSCRINQYPWVIMRYSVTAIKKDTARLGGISYILIDFCICPSRPAFCRDVPALPCF